MNDAPIISLVVPAFNEATHLAGSIGEMRAALEGSKISFEIIVVDDGSRDDTWAMLQVLAREMPELRAVALSRNFGKEAAILAGLDGAKGQAVIVMDADLQHPPSLLPEMIALWQDSGANVVNAVKGDRRNSDHSIAAGLFYGLFNRLSETSLDRASDFKLLDREVVDLYRHLPERNVFFRGLTTWMGFSQVDIEFKVAKRAGGASKWTFSQLLSLATGVVTSFSTVPLHLVTGMGLMFLLFAIVLGIQTLYVKFFGNGAEGFTTVIVLILLTGAVIMIALGIIGQYIAKIYQEVKARPRYLVRDQLPAPTAAKAHKDQND